ncbi:hypothetical protein JW823_06500 [bacterium]|nr:hypothetical protein [candidate division CSSED10-310 bacterium]
MNAVNIWPEEPIRRNRSLIISKTIEIPRQQRNTLWFALPESKESELIGNSDPFVVGLIYLFMQTGLPVHIHGAVSPSLLRNLDDYQDAWVEWLPKLKKVSIRADREEELTLPENRTETVVAFSGGVDSCFTAYRHTQSDDRRFLFKPAAGLIVHGFDIPLENLKAFDSAVDRSKRVLMSLGMETIPVSTNYRSLVSDWSHSFGAAIAACLMLFAQRYRFGLIGQGLTYNESCVLHEGSNPFTDPLLSSDSFRVIPDGTAYSRASKIAAMSQWNEFLSDLRVCWQGPEKDRNCCRCEKCIRNILTFRALGLPQPPCFPLDVTDEQIRDMPLGAHSLPEVRYAGLIKLAAANGITGEWIRILEKRLAQKRRREKSPVYIFMNRMTYYRKRLWSRLTRRG